jgi:hypothetical protein
MYRNQTIRKWMGELKELPAASFPGGYTILYATHQGHVLCNECATKEAEDIEVVTTYDEGPDLYCEECNAVIESSYGDPEEDE